MMDRGRFSLRGAVRLCELHRTSRNCRADACEKEQRIHWTTVEFNRDGTLRRHYEKDPAQPEWTNLYEYDDHGQLREELVEQNGQLTIARRLEYDPAGKLLRVIGPEKNGEQTVMETYSYDSDGRKQKVTHLNLNPDMQNVPIGIGVEGTFLCGGVPGITTVTSNYDQHNRPTEHLFSDSHGELLSRISLLYDDRGNLIEESSSVQKLPAEIAAQCNAEQSEAMRQLFSLGYRHRYDDRNRRIETSSTKPGDDRELRTFAYNDYGDLTSEIRESSNSEYQVESSGAVTTKTDSTRTHRNEIQYRYQYDTRGNWIEKITEAPDGQVWSIERRTIHYFEEPANP